MVFMLIFRLVDTKKAYKGPVLPAETTLLTPTEAALLLEGDHQPHGRVQECGDSPLSSFRQSICGQRPPEPFRGLFSLSTGARRCLRDISDYIH